MSENTVLKGVNIGVIAEEMYTSEALKFKPVPTGFYFIDSVTHGLWRGLPQIIAAESGNGKSTIMRNMALRQALAKELGGYGLKVLIISLEMTRELLAAQFFALLTKEEMQEWFAFNVDEKEIETVREKALALSKALPNLHIDDEAKNADDIAKIIEASNGVYDVIYIDYFQAIDLNEGASEGQAYNRASKVITRAAKRSKEVAVVLLSQVTAQDGKKAKTEKEHREAKLRYAKQLLNDAAFELIIYRDEEGDDEKPDYDNENNMINFFIRKNRNGLQEQHERYSFIGDKGIIGDWESIEVKENPYTYLNKDWSDKRPFFHHDMAYIGELNLAELKCAGYNIPSEQAFQYEVREDIFTQYPNVFKGIVDDEYFEEEKTEEKVESFHDISEVNLDAIITDPFAHFEDDDEYDDELPF